MDWTAIEANSAIIVKSLVMLMTQGVCVLIGVLFMYSGISKMIAHARGYRQGQPTVGPVLGHLGIGALMVQLYWTVGVISESLFNSRPGDPNAAMAYLPIKAVDNTMLESILRMGLTWVYCIGFIAVIRGLVLWNALASGESRGQDQGWKGFWHILFGAAAVNLTGVLQMFLPGAGAS